MRLLILNAHSARNLGDDAIMYETISSLKTVFPSPEITIAANDPVSWRHHVNVDVEVVGSFTSWFVECQGARWRAKPFLSVVYLLLLLFAVAVFRLFRWQLRFGSRDQRRLLDAYYRADKVLSCGGGNFYAHRVFSPFFICALLTLAFAEGLTSRLSCYLNLLDR